eukprot:TRINITY_DN3712_c0_g1_i1.p1 TRINITY_DN3712_c0_g1~~TRINITY_DN3712_c0_g1_i1.p1  ORF type:complete len:518 (-),score=73.22 TRINITY_DN3712_c0_g1_i1:383-1936(-)
MGCFFFCAEPESGIEERSTSVRKASRKCSDIKAEAVLNTGCNAAPPSISPTDSKRLSGRLHSNDDALSVEAGSIVQGFGTSEESSREFSAPKSGSETSEEEEANSAVDGGQPQSGGPLPPNPAPQVRSFAFDELSTATEAFATKNLLGEGGFGCVYKGVIPSTGEVVAVKQLDRSGLQGNREFLVEVLMLSLLHHPHLVHLIGYCADGDQRILVYEFMDKGALEDHLLGAKKGTLDWNTRMKIAAGAAKGLEYLHARANPPVIFRDLKTSNILLDENFHPKLSDFGLAKLGPTGDKTHVSTRVMGTYGYCAPEYAMSGQLTVKSDVYSFGVVLLELISGKRAIDNCRPVGEHNLVTWARPLFKDRKKFPLMADPSLEGRYPLRGLYQALAVAAMCLQEQASARPSMGDVVTALAYLASQSFDPNHHPPALRTPSPVQSPRQWNDHRLPSSRSVAASPVSSPALGANNSKHFKHSPKERVSSHMRQRSPRAPTCHDSGEGPGSSSASSSKSLPSIKGN